MGVNLSLEFFPPRTEAGAKSLLKVAEKLKPLNPDFCSVTYGAGGTTRTGTKDTVAQLRALGFDSAPHLSIGTDEKPEIHRILDDYKLAGVSRLVALRGDLPSGSGVDSHSRSHNAEALVRWVREHAQQRFKVIVAAYPETHPDAKSQAADLEYFHRKVDAGADEAITQYFYNPHAYIDFVNRCRQANVTIPIVPGIMPITNFEGIVRFSKACGAEIPRWIYKTLEALQDDEPGLRRFGVECVTRLCEDLLQAGAPGLHFYTLNRWGATTEICRNLHLADRSA